MRSTLIYTKQDKRHQVYKYVHNKIRILWIECIREFVETTIQHIIVDTGMSYASLQPLGEKVRLKTILRESLRGRGPRRTNEVYDAKGWPGSGGTKGPQLGRRLGESAYTLSFGDPLHPNFEFGFKINVLQYYLHESLENYNESQNWRSLELGQQAFIAHWQANLDRVLDPVQLLNEMM